MAVGKMESPDCALSCKIITNRVGVTTIKEAAKKWAVELYAGYSSLIMIIYKINDALVFARLHLFCIQSKYI